MSETEQLDRAIAVLHAALQTLKLNETEQQLEELCEMMAMQDLPISARLFILGQGVHTLHDIDVKDQALIDAAEDAVKLEFKIRDLKNFVRYCKEGSHDYDYLGEPAKKSATMPPSTASAAAAAAAAAVAENSASCTGSNQRPPQPELPLRRADSTAVPDSADRRQSTDPGYWSAANSCPPPLPPPKAKPRRPSVASQQETATGMAAAAARGHRTSDPGAQPLRPPGGGGGSSGSCANRLLRLFIFPDKAKKEKQQKKLQKALYTA